MVATARKGWDYLKGSFWAVPTALLAGSFGLAWLTLTMDRGGGGEAGGFASLVQVSDARAARTMLGTLSGALATVAGVTFSITVVALVLAASQYGSRVIRLFMRDGFNQTALGVLLGSFAYSVLIMGAVGDQADGGLPRLSLAVSLVLSLGSLLIWTFFIHHVSMLLQSELIAAAVHRDFDRAVAAFEKEPPGAAQARRPDGEPGRVAAGKDGYLQAVDRRVLVRAAAGRDAVIRLLRRPGHFIRRGDVVAEVWPAEAAVEIERDIRKALALGPQRTYAEDLEYAAEQLVQMAVRALSPGINDFFTAEACVDWLSAGLQRLVGRQEGTGVLADEAGRARVVLSPWRIHRVVAAAFDPIREAARGNVAVTIRLLEAVKAVAAAASDPPVVDELRRQLDMLERGLRDVPERQDRRDASRRLAQTRRELRAAPPRR